LEISTVFVAQFAKADVYMMIVSIDALVITPHPSSFRTCYFTFMNYVRYAFIGFRMIPELVSKIQREPFLCTQVRININGSDTPIEVWIVIRDSRGMATITHPSITFTIPIREPIIDLLPQLYASLA
jgi:hypothetical protein